MCEPLNLPKIKTAPGPPPGLKALIDNLRNVYPEQPNPLTVTTLLKYWLGGQDPLDYISMYHNHGDVDKGIPPHWHYISFGLSDLHGDNRVHVRDNAVYNTRSGMGFELTFRLIKTKEELTDQQEQPEVVQKPPTWPANLLQAIAKYCFQTGNRLCFGDNIPWRKSLDGSIDSYIRNILIAQDPQLNNIVTPYGSVDFCQIVGVIDDELEQASRWNGGGVLNYLSHDTVTGGQWLVTNMKRKESVFELFPETLLSLQDDLEKQGSDLAGVNAEFTFREVRESQTVKHEIDSFSLNEQCLLEEDNPMELSQSDENKEEKVFPQSMFLSSNSLHKSCPLDYQAEAPDCISFDGIEITLAPYAGKFLLLAIKDRIRHGRHFTFKAQNLALTLVAESVTGTIVKKDAPYGVLGYWIQVLIPDDMVANMTEVFQNANFNSEERLIFDWPDRKLKFIIDNPQPIPRF